MFGIPCRASLPSGDQTLQSKEEKLEPIMQMDNQITPKKVRSFCSFRYGLSLLLHLCNVALMAQNMCLNLTMVIMVNSTGPHSLPNTSTEEHLENIKGSALISQHMIWVKWAPPLERGRLTTLSLSGNLLGSFIVLLVTGFICQSLGWPMVFYIFGACGCALSLLWFVLFYDDPKDHPCISISEKEYILSCLNQQVSSSTQSLPIKAMIKSLPFWAIAFGSFAFHWTNTIMVLYTPTFIKAKLHVNIKENGLLSALPYLFAWSFGILVGHLTDFFLSRNILRLITIQKLFNTLGLLLPAFFSLCLLYLSSSIYSMTIFLILASSTGSFCMGGVLINGLDIAPSFYGFLKGVTAIIGMIGRLISSTLCGVILNQDPESAWFKIFILMAVIDVLCLLFCLVFGKADIQDWAKGNQEHTRL
ncbi:sodium-dependent phosphate transport protein 1 isoform X14 [Vulpes vulpes]|uniref:Sodium-dependent phosphate transport protein 1 isoform X14 n=2 Tax=Vulpes vulpes TaxID=9627 RepID=A0A3Q7SI90_VULVU